MQNNELLQGTWWARATEEHVAIVKNDEPPMKGSGKYSMRQEDAKSNWIYSTYPTDKDRRLGVCFNDFPFDASYFETGYLYKVEITENKWTYEEYDKL